MGDAGGIIDSDNSSSSSSSSSSLPVPHPTRSYWQQCHPNDIARHRTTSSLPESASVVIIGSGISGAFAARHFAGRGQEGVVVLEAREVCSGATGRNGGHCQPLIYEQPPGVAEFELRNYYAIANLIKETNVACEYHQLKGCHAYYSQKYFDEAKTETLELQRQYPHLMNLVEIVEDRERLAALKVPDASGALVQKTAASLSPYKLVTSIFTTLVRDGKINLQTDTPVLSITAAAAPDNDKASSSSRWNIETPRGTISTAQVLLTTNAYTSHLLPQFASLIVPVQGEMSALKPAAALLSQPLDHSYVFIGVMEQDRMQDDYLVQRPPELGGELMFGGGRLCAQGAGVGTTDDSYVDKVVAKYLRTVLPRMLDMEGEGPRPELLKDLHNVLELNREAENKNQQREQKLELEPKSEWTGIMGFSRDHHPWVGSVPGMPGVWLCAGYTGHGMPNAALCATHVAQMISNSIEGGSGGGATATATHADAEADADAAAATEADALAAAANTIPATYLISEERMRRAKDFPEIRGEAVMQAPKQILQWLGSS